MGREKKYYYGKNTKKKVAEEKKSLTTTQKEKLQRSYEQLRISGLEMDLDETRTRLEFYKCALNVINEIALEITEIDLLKKTGEQLSIRRTKKKL